MDLIKSAVFPCVAAAAASKNLVSRQKKLEAEVFQQQELVYGQDFTIADMQRQLARLEGTHNEKEQEQFQLTLNQLQISLQAENDTNTLLTTQLRKVEVCTLLPFSMSGEMLTLSPDSISVPMVMVNSFMALLVC